ncbi:Major facilitator superfamily domain general substrate transporter [Penicillium expansum]|nr:Major facilitator superfamily domain general substrate transporter [Penicillium expansum]
MGKIYTIGLATFAATGSFLFGYDSGVMTDVIASPNFLNFFNTTKASTIIGAINSTFSGGAAIGALMAGLTIDRFGRRRTIQLGALLATIGAILQSAARNLVMILVGRIVAGWAVGILSMSVPVYQAECAHPKSRGLIVGLSQQMIGVGFIVSTLVVPITFPLDYNTYAYQECFGSRKSPRHLIEKDQDDEALRILKRLHYDGANMEWIQTEFTEIKATISAERVLTASGWTIMFKVPQWRTRLLQGTLVQVFSQMTGINVINYYQNIMYEALGITGSRATLVTGIYNVVGPLTNLLFITFVLDRIGRRRPLLFGAAGITIALVCEAALNSQNEDGTKTGYSIGGVFFLFAVTVLFSMSFGSISWVYMSEVMPMQIRGKGVAFATGIGNWTVSTLWSQVSPIALGKIGWKFYLIFAAWNVCVTIPTIFFWFKETKQKSLEEIDLLFGGRALGILNDNLHPKALELETVGTARQLEDVTV